MNNNEDLKPFRVNIRMSKKMVDFYDDMAKEMAVSRSYVMVMALKTYMDQQSTINMIDVYNKQLQFEKDNKQT